ncbi:unnamed protein product [Notodromas monacha]|uniref:Uncharacterized protein n=1 Tax=Notodromas monacha TaxID=399045 RepID=A0A7R9GK42_9CRUS|nr:unnamed protein product [Notodromas monacha]CAG0923487.1 unnamed protein product [Notodromas monacha]
MSLLRGPLPYAFAGKKLRSGRNLQLENGTSNADELDIIRESIIKGSKIPPKFDNNFGKKSQLKNYDEDEEVTEIILSRSLACARFPSPVKFLVEKENGVLRLRALGVDLRAIEELDAFKAVDGDIPIIGGDSFTQPTVKRKRGRPRKLRPGL